MQPNREMMLCHYFYDPLDRLTAYTPSEQASTQRYYLNDRLASEIQGAVQYSIMQFDDHLLAQQRRLDGTVETNVLATDLQRSVLAVLDSKSQSHSLFYAPYGHRPMESGLLSLLGFNGERRDSVTGHYLLGNGYRAFNPVLMRFNSPDSWSPFGEGGLNAYGYCDNNPVNKSDPTGHRPFPAAGATNNLARVSNRSKAISRKPLYRTTVQNAGPRETNMSNIKFIDDGIFSFTDYDNKIKRFNIAGHGDEIAPREYAIRSSTGSLTAHTLANTIKSDSNNHVYIRLIMCNSATGQHPFASKIAELTKLPTKGYFGPVSGLPHPEHLLELIRTNNKAIQRSQNGTYAYEKPMTVFKKNPYGPRDPIPFNYAPIMYFPS